MYSAHTALPGAIHNDSRGIVRVLHVSIGGWTLCLARSDFENVHREDGIAVRRLRSYSEDVATHYFEVRVGYKATYEISRSFS
jgi:hypothetical protein